MKHYLCYIGVLTAITLIAVIFTVYCKEGNTVKDFLSAYGIEVEPTPIEVVEFAMPRELDDVYKNYNQIQNEAGLDLLPYCGEKAIRYTYIMTNYPDDENNFVRVNVIMVGDKPIGGDMCTVALDGFMRPLNYLLVTKDKSE